MMINPLKRILFSYLKGQVLGIPVVAQRVKNLRSVYKDEGSIPSLAQWAKNLMLPKLQCSSDTA